MDTNSGILVLFLTMLLISILFAIFNRPDKKIVHKTISNVKIKKRDSEIVIDTILEIGDDKSYILPELKQKFTTSIDFFKKYKIIEAEDIKKV